MPVVWGYLLKSRACLPDGREREQVCARASEYMRRPEINLNVTLGCCLHCFVSTALTPPEIYWLVWAG